MLATSCGVLFFIVFFPSGNESYVHIPARLEPNILSYTAVLYDSLSSAALNQQISHFPFLKYTPSDDYYYYVRTYVWSTIIVKPSRIRCVLLYFKHGLRALLPSDDSWRNKPQPSAWRVVIIHTRYMVRTIRDKVVPGIIQSFWHVARRVGAPTVVARLCSQRKKSSVMSYQVYCVLSSAAHVIRNMPLS